MSAAAVLGPRSAAAEPPPETNRIRIFDAPAACLAPQWVAEELLKAEGFTDVQFIKPPEAGASFPEYDVAINDAPNHVLGVEKGWGEVALTGLHAGCYELLVTNRVRSIRDLKGKIVAVPREGGRRAFVSAMAASVGLDPVKDINWVVRPEGEGMQLFARGRSMPFSAFPPSRRSCGRRRSAAC